MSSAPGYNHRSIHPGGPGPGLVNGQPPPASRFNDMLDELRREHDYLYSEVSALKLQRDDLESKLNSQINELHLVQKSMSDLESSYNRQKKLYEEELGKLRAEIDGPGYQSSHSRKAGHSLPEPPGPHLGGPPSLASSSSLAAYHPRERDWIRPERLRDRDREPAPLVLDTRSEREREQQREVELNRAEHERERRERLTHMRERDRERDQDRLMDVRDPKRSKRQDYSPHLHALPPPLPPHPSASGPFGPKTLPPLPPVPPHGSMDHRESTHSEKPFQVSPITPGIGTSMSTSSPIAGPPLTGSPNAQIVLSDLDLNSLPQDMKKENKDWHCVFNPNLKRKALDIDLKWNFHHPSVVCCVQFSADGKWLATGCNKTAQIYDVSNGSKVCALVYENNADDLYIRSVRFSPDGNYLATGAEDKKIRIWDIKTKRVIVIFSGHTQEIYSLEFTPDGRYIVSGSGDATAKIWSLAPFIQHFQRGDSMGASSPNPNDAMHCRTLTVNEAAPPRPPTPNGSSAERNDGGVTSVAVSHDGRFMAAGSLDNIVRIWEIATGMLVDRLRGHESSVYSVVFTPDGKGVVSGSLDMTMKLWDISPLYTMKVREVGTGSGVGRCVSEFRGHKDYVLSAAVSSDGKWIVSGSKDRCVQFWDSKTSIVQCMLQGHKNSVISINVNPMQPLLATGSGDQLARVWSYKLL